MITIGSGVMAQGFRHDQGGAEFILRNAENMLKVATCFL